MLGNAPKPDVQHVETRVVMGSVQELVVSVGARSAEIQHVRGNV